MIAIQEVFELASEVQGGAEFDAESVKIAEIEAGDESGAEPKAVAELVLAASGSEADSEYSSEIVVAWRSGL